MKNIFTKVNIKRFASYVLVAALASAATWFIAPKTTKLEVLATVIENRFIGESDPVKIKDAAAAGMIAALGDQWSYYIPAQAYSDHVNRQNNDYVGIGTSIARRADGKGFDVVAVAEGGPAQEAGILPGDIITHVDGEPVMDLDVTELKTRIMGKRNTRLILTILRGDANMDFTVTRKTIHNPAAFGQMLTQTTGLVTISNFHENAGDEAIAAVEELLAQGAEAIAFDVRNNPGGYVREMIEILDYLLPKGDLFRSVNSNGWEEVDRSDADCLEIPMAVLINGNSYSSAELFAAILREYDWAVTVGEPTTGKAYYQTTIELGDGSAVQLSTGAYTTPNGVNLTEAGGLVPDIPVEPGVPGAEAADDPQIQAAIRAVSEETA